MKEPRKKPAELHMNSKKFDQMMRQALQVAPGETPKFKGSIKAKVARKKK